MTNHAWASRQSGSGRIRYSLAALLGAVVVLSLAAMVLVPACNGRAWYGYHISFHALQFADMNGDGLPDLVTCGYKGMVAGNAACFAGRGGRFDDWKTGHNLQFPSMAAIYFTRVLDLDGDGQGDLISDTGIWMNRGGLFRCILDFRKRGASASDQKSLDELAEWGIGPHSMEACDIQCCELTGDGENDLVFLRQDEMVLGLSQGKLAWKFVYFPLVPGIGIDPGKGGKARLAVVGPSLNEILPAVTACGVRIRSIPIAQATYVSFRHESGNGVDFAGIDLDGDGVPEWVHLQDGGKPTVSVFRETASGLVLASSFQPGGFSGMDWVPKTPPFCRFTFADFDRDGKLDFLGSDGVIHRQGENLQFTAAATVHLEAAIEGTRLYACDVNGDGWMDVVSSYQPFWNLRLGPFLGK